jgi:general secretion pathway protein D
MRLASEVNQQALYKIATRTLAPYGVTTSMNDDIIVFSFSENASAQDTPLLVSGRALPEVPFTNRPLFYAYPLKAVDARVVLNYINQLFKSNELTTEHDAFSNSLVFQGQKAKIEQAVAAVQLFDRPEMSGMFSIILEPRISDVKTFSSNLEKILKTEGFNVGIADRIGLAIRILPLESSNQVIVFAKSREILDHIERWANKIEVQKQNEIENGLFFYRVQRTLASHIVGVLSQLGVANYSAPSDESNSQQGANRSLSRPTENSQVNAGESSGAMNGNYTVDKQLNTILFSGSGKQWQKVLPVIKKLDKHSPSVMVEVILVEVQLNDSEETGVEWLANSSLDDFDLSFGTLGSLGLKGSGLNLFGLDNAGNTRAAINAFYKNDRANIRSRPRIMVKSGGQASIDVGNEIPVITSTSQSTTDSNAPNIQNVQYRKTGVILDIKPTVHASGFVDIEINQALSEATESSSAGNPVILNRSISTTVTLRDGGSVLIGGLISSTSSEGSQGVPILGRLPLIGKLFRTDNNAQDRTELMIMIIPYILETPGEAEALTDELQMQRIQSFN